MSVHAASPLLYEDEKKKKSNIHLMDECVML